MKTLDKTSYTGQIIQYLILLLFACFTLAPFVFLFVSSLRPGSLMVQNGLTLDLDIRTMDFTNYKELINYNNGRYFIWYKNSIIITSVQTVGSLLFSSMVGYALAVYHFKGQNLVFITVLIIMMIPVELLILPLFKLVVNLRIIDTVAGVVLPFIVSPFAIFFFRQYALGLPIDLIDSGRIDGSGEFGIFFRIMTPVMKPAFGAVAILQAMNSWNGFVWPLIALRSNEHLTLPIGLQSLLTPYGNNYNVLLAGAVISIIPIVIIFLFNQKSFISGLTVGSVKG